MSGARVLMLAPFPREAAYTRYRMLQFVPDLAAAGIESDVKPFLTSAEFQGYYAQGTRLAKAARLAAAVTRRIRDTVRTGAYDAVILGREALLFGPPLLEMWLTRRLRGRVVFDFDDAIYLPSPNTAWGRWSGLAARLKCPAKTDAILARSASVLAGNDTLVEHARRFNGNVTVMPTVVDVEEYPDATSRPSREPATVGWVGTHTTARYLEAIAPALAEVARRRPFRLRLVGAGDDTCLPGVDVERVPWSLEREFAVFADLDIGIYPLSDTPWTRGKCGFKAIQYLAAGLPAVCSPVGVTTDIVEHERTGLLARTHPEWVMALERLLADAALRREMGTRGRRAIRERWSRQVHAPRFVAAVEAVLAGGQVFGCWGATERVSG